LIKSIGLDIVEISRITKNIEHFGDKFVLKILGDEELAFYRKRFDKASFLAGRFAAKEAVIKGLGFFLKDRPAFPLIQILNDYTGQPYLELPLSIKKQLKESKCLISITHEKNNAAAVAIFLEEK